MALIPCPHCGKNVSDSVETCIHCGGDIKIKLKADVKLPNKKKPDDFEMLPNEKRKALRLEYDSDHTCYLQYDFKRKLVWGISIATAVLLLCFLISFYILLIQADHKRNHAIEMGNQALEDFIMHNDFETIKEWMDRRGLKEITAEDLLGNNDEYKTAFIQAEETENSAYILLYVSCALLTCWILYFIPTMIDLNKSRIKALVSFRLWLKGEKNIRFNSASSYKDDKKFREMEQKEK